MTLARYRWACFSCFCLFSLTAPTLRVGAQTAPAPAPAVPAFVTAQLADVEATREVLHNVREVVGEFQASLKIVDPNERYLALIEGTKRLHALAPPPEIRAALEATLEVLKPEPPPAIFLLLDEQKKWDQIADTVDSEVRRSGQELDALRLVRQALSGEPKHVELLLQGEHMLETLASESATPRVARLLKYTREIIASLPPPALFTTNLGIDLVLVTLDPPVYVSKEPVKRKAFVSKQPVTWKAFAAFLNEANLAPKELLWPAAVVRFDPATRKYTAADPDAPVLGVPHDLADAFCQWASGKTQIEMELPTDEQLRRSPPPETIALWTSTPYQPPEAFDRDMQKLFGAVMFKIWDPLKKISAEEMTGDLPFATHPVLGFRVAASVESVKKARLERVHAEMNLPPHNATAGPAKPAGNLP